MNMGFQELMERCHNTGYKKLSMGKKPVGTSRRCGMMRRMNRRLKGFRFMITRKLKWRSFWIAMMPLRKTFSICCEMLNQMKVDGSYPAISQWGLPVLAHPSSRCRRNYPSNVSFYRKPADNISHIVSA
ncbi:hypothetical protein CTI12_AA316220 [Artemisia annua]|uniref:Uncharacterized protein n=1 Tax=Artemisia annua TaxID=35608 RepID=A0A2U1LZX8_ARTAN|nr:hypothetical protein CTI12_AA316220 [Artemisia annua]